MLLFVVSVLLALSVSFLCSLLEATLLSLTPSQVADLSARHPRLGAIWQGFKSNIERPIAVILMLNTAAHTVGATVAGSQVPRLFGGEWIALFSVLFTYAMLQFTEILPKTLGVRFNRELATVVGRPLQAATALLAPVLHLIHWVNRPFEPKRVGAVRARTVDEILALAHFAQLSREIGAHQERIIEGASRLSTLPVRAVMIPVDHVSFLSASATLLDAVIAAHTDAHTRYPVCEDSDPDKVAGYINFKEMIYHMRTNPNDPSLRGIIRPVAFVPPDESAANLLRMFVEQHIHMAIVRDPGGRTLGLATLEDLVEELVGELEDEFDRLPRMFQALSGGTWMVGGGVLAGEVRQRLGLDLPDFAGTVSAWLSQRLGRVPRPGDVHREAGAEFTVRRVKRGKVFEVAVSRGRTGAGAGPSACGSGT